MPRALFLCSGTGSVGEPFRRHGWEVIDVDWDGRYGAEVQCDILTWDYKNAFPQAYFDVIWASPDCTQYSIARTTARTPRNFAKADALVQKCREIIDYFEPGVWFIENPDTGYLKSRPFMQNLPYVRVDYCMYRINTDTDALCPYRKRTRIWTNAQWTPKMCDRSHLINGRHAMTAQRGPCKHRGISDRFALDELHRLPAQLCGEIYNVALQRLGVMQDSETHEEA